MRNLLTVNRAAMLSVAMLVVSLATPAQAVEFTGVVQLGGTHGVEPQENATVRLYEATTAAPTLLGSATTDEAGEFTVTVPSSTSTSVFFLTADLRGDAQFVSILGSTLPSSATVNELTTVAAAWSMAQFYRTGSIAGDTFALQIAAGMNENIVDPVTGQSSTVLLTSPNADQTHSLRMTRSLSNLVTACARSRLIRLAVYAVTRSERERLPNSIGEALANLARNPAQNVSTLYGLSKLHGLYRPVLHRQPDAWTVTVKVNDSGDDSRMFGGPARVEFDSRGYAWIANNVVQGEPTSSDYIMVLQPNGKPANGTNGTPISPITGGGLLGAGLGIAIDPFESVWVGNFGWGKDNPTADGNGSVSQFGPDGTAISGPLGYQGGPVRVQGVVSDIYGNIWMCSYGTDQVYVFLDGQPDQVASAQLYKGSQPFHVQMASENTAWVTSGGGFKGVFPSSVAKYTLENGALERQFLQHLGKALKTVAVDSQGNAWVASQGDSKVYALRPDGQLLGAFDGGGINGPWGVIVDADDNVWVGNFGPLEHGSNFNDSRVSKLAGANPSTRPRGKKLGDPLTPKTGYTVHSAGEPVLLHNGEPLYGAGGPPCFAPLMRMTGVSVDRAGNLWAVNNWKPRFEIDVQGGNPGGDGVVIFVGLATPTAGN